MSRRASPRPLDPSRRPVSAASLPIFIAALVAGCVIVPPAPGPTPTPTPVPDTPAPDSPQPPAPDPPSRAAQLDSGWCASVAQPFAQVADAYPFSAAGADLPLDDFTRWFAPGQGPLWQFYDASLATLVPRDGGVFAIADTAAAAGVTVDAALPGFLGRVADLGTVLFPPGATTPTFEFEVQIDGTPGVTEIDLTVDGTTVKYRNGPRSWQPLRWPGTGDARGASLTAKGLGATGQLSHQGDWGLWRLLADATVPGLAGQREYTAKWDLASQQLGVVTVHVRPRRDENPLFGVPGRGVSAYLGLFRGLQAPSPIAGGLACSAATGATGAVGAAGARPPVASR
ncbi:MAG: hypothetical protein H6708_31540 [Kofleriaceae bacterium]|nr:hypothetical protein [Myxococcales bacterium]MCB9564941.1 hypothetical protein [Kofleriaceae bacterium]